LIYDSIEYPSKQIKPPEKINQDVFLKNFEHFDRRELKEAQNLIDEEFKYITNIYGEYDPETFGESWENSFSDMMYIPSRKKFGLVSHVKSEDIRVSSIQHFYDNTIAETKQLSKRVQGIEKKAQVYLGGYLKVAATKEKEIHSLYQQISQQEVELECFNVLRENEENAIINRLAKLKADVQSQRDQEKLAQERFSSLVAEREQLVQKKEVETC